ncbi:MAG: type II toxin-antitoxin system HigB family toxin [Acidobacteriota bacterium]
MAEAGMDFRHADPEGTSTVFNIKGNHYRLIADARYQTQRVFVFKVMTNKQYDTEVGRMSATVTKRSGKPAKTTRPVRAAACATKTSNHCSAPAV